ncbi:hypothetical protein [Sodalis sp. RH19]
MMKEPAAGGGILAGMARQNGGGDIGALGRALKKIIAWLRDLFNSD